MVYARIAHLIVFMAIAAGAGVSAEVLKNLGTQGPSNASGPQLTQILQAVNVSGRNLASIRVATSSKSVRDSWVAQHGNGIYFAPAWFSSDWRLLETGKEVYANDALMSPRYTDTPASTGSMAPRRFPTVLARDPYAEKCPYIYAFPTRFYCLSEHLETEAQFGLPAGANNYRILDGDVWVITLQDGFLAHRFDMVKKEFADHAVPLQSIVAAVKAGGYTDADVSHMKPYKRNKKAEEEITQYLSTRETYIKDHGAREEVSATFQDFEKPLYEISSSFQYDLATDGKKVGILLRKPLGLVSATWPAAENARFMAVTKEDLPQNFMQLNMSRLFLGGLEFSGSSFFGSIETLAPFTYGYLLARNPEAAQRLKENSRNKEDIKLDSYVGQEPTIVGVRFEGSRVVCMALNPDDEWDPDGPTIFAFKPGQVWTSVTNLKNHWSRGIARIQ